MCEAMCNGGHVANLSYAQRNEPWAMGLPPKGMGPLTEGAELTYRFLHVYVVDIFQRISCFRLLQSEKQRGM